MSKILVVSTYPIKNAQHGGQKRLAAIIEKYKESGNTVVNSAVYMNDFYQDADPDDIAVNWDNYVNRELAGYTSDLLLAEALAEDLDVKNKFKDALRKFKPDFIHIEQPFLFKAIYDILAKESWWAGALIYGSQNIEYELKEYILENTPDPIDPKVIKHATDNVKELEIFAIKNADWSLACTESDAQTIKKHGAKNVYLAQNGIDKTEISGDVSDTYRKKYLTNGVEKIALFVGSGHPPNLSGYVKMIGFGIGFIPPEARIVVVGGVSDMINNHLNNVPNYIRAVYDKRVQLLGRVSEENLTGLLSIADIILLPITEGGGSNLKTAEAIIADKKIVGTETAFRSFEQFIDLPNVYVANNAKDFKESIVKAFDTTRKDRSQKEILISESALWKNTLITATEAIDTYEK